MESAVREASSTVEPLPGTISGFTVEPAPSCSFHGELGVGLTGSTVEPLSIDAPGHRRVPPWNQLR